MKVSKSKLAKKVIIFGLSLIVAAVGGLVIDNKFHNQVSGWLSTAQPLFIDNKFCDNPATQPGCISFISNVLAAGANPYQSVTSPVTISSGSAPAINNPQTALLVKDGYLAVSYNTGYGGQWPSYGAYNAAIGWNFSSGSGSVDFWNTSSAVVTPKGFKFRQQTAAGAQTELLSIGSDSKVSFGTSLYNNGSKLTLYENTSGGSVYGFGITAGSLDVYSGGVQAMAIKSDRLEVNGTGWAGLIRMRNTAAVAGKYWQIGPNPNNAFVVYNQSGNTGPYLLDDGQPTASGQSWGWNGVSDQRLKTNIRPLDTKSGLQAINQLNPVTFNWLNVKSTKTTQTGFIAQEVQKVLPELVSTAPETTITLPDGSTQKITDALGLNYTGFIPYLVKSIQEQQVEIDLLKQKIQELKNK